MTSTETGTRTFSEEDFDRMRSFIGVDLNIVQYNEEATSDTIRHYAYGIGDDNPLWIDEEYGRASRFNCRTAPPTFIYSIFSGEVSRGLPEGCQPFHVGAEIEFDRPILIGERISAKAHLMDVQRKESPRVGLMAVQLSEMLYYAQDGSRVARLVQKIISMFPPTDPSQRLYQPRTTSESSAELMERIERDVLAEVRRGDEPRFWEDVSVGEKLSPVVKGPLDRTCMTAYYAGAIGDAAVYRGLEPRWKTQHAVRTDPDNAPNNFDPWIFLSHSNPGSGHQDEGIARQIGMPGAYDNGNQRTSWLAHLMTNWIGDDGELVHLRCEMPRPNVFGDTLWISGVVERKHEEMSQKLVDVSITGTNQLGDDTTRGWATVRLPSRD